MNLDAFIATVKKSTQQVYFFHFTDTRNLASITEHGLLSMKNIRENDIETQPGGDESSVEIDRKLGMDQYVHLCFFDNHPMEYGVFSNGNG